MINDFDNLIFNLENGNSYELIDNVVYDNHIYVYLINVNDELDSLFRLLVKNDDGYILEDIDSTQFRDNIFPLFVEKFENY